MRNKGNFFVGLLLILLLCATYTWATWKYFTRVVPGGNDFMAHYTAWEAYLKHGFSPYSDEAALYTQKSIRGRPALPGEDQNRLTYPFYSIIIHAPFILFDYALARALYMTLLQIALVIGIILTLRLFDWSPPSWLLMVILVWALFYYPEARGIILGQFAIFGYLSLAGTLYLIKYNRESYAGILLVLSTVKPTLVFLIVPFLIIWGFLNKRSKFLISFAGTLFVFLLASFLMLPSWFKEWIFRISKYSDYTVGQSPAWLLTHDIIPILGGIGEAIIVILLCTWMFWSWWTALSSKNNPRFYWALGVTLVVSSLILPRTATTNYVMMLIPILWIFGKLDREFRRGRSILVIVMIVTLAGLWWLHYATVVGNQEQAIMFLPQPIILAFVLVFGRHWLLSGDEVKR